MVVGLRNEGCFSFLGSLNSTYYYYLLFEFYCDSCSGLFEVFFDGFLLRRGSFYFTNFLNMLIFWSKLA